MRGHVSIEWTESCSLEAHLLLNLAWDLRVLGVGDTLALVVLHLDDGLRIG